MAEMQTLEEWIDLVDLMGLGDKFCPDCLFLHQTLFEKGSVQKEYAPKEQILFSQLKPLIEKGGKNPTWQGTEKIEIQM